MRCAIIGLACIFPGAPDVDRFWSNIVDGVDCITEVPAARWDKRFYDPHAVDVDRFYCNRGGFVDDYAYFDPLQFGVVPNAADSIEPDQLLTLRMGWEALRDAGYADRAFPRARTGVIIGRGNYIGAGVLRLEQHVRLLPQILQTLEDLFPDLSPAALDAAKSRLKARFAYYGPDVAAGMIPNLLASRLANRLDLHGPAYTVDAACASSLIAVEHACASLARGETDLMLVGGAHLTHDLTFWATFCQLGALSRSGVSRPFSQQADGILAAEGVGIAVLKRLDDAVKDGDRIYAVIEGVGSSSDGRSGSLVAPSMRGQILALEKAWGQADVARARIGLLEAHGTGTPTGDAVELETVAAFFGPALDDTIKPVIGSVKSMIGHAMPASGLASLIKAALSVYHGVLPPTLHCEAPHDGLGKTGFRVIGRAEPWQTAAEQRVAAVNAFGFGGINAHIVLRGVAGQNVPVTLPKVLMLAADTPAALLAQLDAGAPYPAPGAGACRLAVIALDEKKLAVARKAVAAGKPWNGRQQLWFSPKGLLTDGGKLAFVFPGVGAAFQPRVDGLAAYFGVQPPAAREAAGEADSLAATVVTLLGLNRYLFNRLADLRICPQGFAGHSVGEWSAMLCAGMIDQDLADRTTAHINLDSVTFPDALFLAAGCDATVLQGAMAGLDRITVSHDNCPHQSMACGARHDVEQVAGRLRDGGIFNQIMPFRSGFHSPFFAEHMPAFRGLFGAAEMAEPEIPVWSATTAKEFPTSRTDKQALALDHLLRPVRFRPMIEAMHDAGYRVFVEVGTGALTGFIADTLGGRPHHAMQTNREDRGGLAQLQYLSAALWVEGAAFDHRLLCGGRHASQPAGRRLALGVGLVRLDTPLEASLMPERAVVTPQAANANDRVGTLILETLADIERAGRDVLAMWQAHHAGTVAPGRLSVRFRQVLDTLTTIPYVKDHEFYCLPPDWPFVEDRRPVVPMTMEVMLVREAVETQLPGQKVVEMTAIQAYKWLDVSRATEVEIFLESRDDGAIDAEIVGYFKACVHVAPAYPAAAGALLPALVNPRATEADAISLYTDRWMFHGPAYQGVRAFHAIGDNGIDAALCVTDGKGALLDSMGQVAGYWVMEQRTDCLAMPIGIKRIRFFSDDPARHAVMQTQMRIAQLDDLNCISDHVLRDADGHVAVTIEGWHTRRYRIDRDFWLRLRKPGLTPVAQVVPGNVTVFEDVYDTAIVRDHIARSYLTARERDLYDKVSPRRRRQWLSGRVVAKDAILAYARQQGLLLYPQEIVIENNALGAPVVVGNVTRRIPKDWQVSIAHKGKLAAAIVGENAVGIDIEHVDARDEGFMSLAFAPAERVLMQAEPQDIAATRFWVAKEAVAKAGGTGLTGRPQDFIVEARDGNCVRVNGIWVVTHMLHDHVIGWTLNGAAFPRSAEEAPILQRKSS